MTEIVYYIDIDNTICKSEGNDYKNSQPLANRINKINALFEAGHTIIYWTARGSKTGIDWSEFTSEQLDNWGCKYHMVLFKKPSYDIWIDDKAINSEDFFADAYEDISDR